MPVGTFNGFCCAKAGFAEGEQFWNTAASSPSPARRREREASGDPRPSIEERYPSHGTYVDAVARVCEARIAERLMLREDADRFIEAAERNNPFDPSVALGPLIQVRVAPGG